MANGYITQIVGPVVDVRFEEGKIPGILNALKVKSTDNRVVVLEVLQHTGDSCVRCVAMSAMDEASKSAEEMLGALQITYNRARQAGITQEMSEIVGGSAALA